MSVRSLIEAFDRERAGREMHALAADLYPICRSITGNGFRQTLDLLERVVPLQRTEVPTGERVLDWNVPREWNVRGAWLRGPDGSKVVDFSDHTLHLLNYSVPFQGRLPLAELQPHLHSLEDRPDWIPYRTSYYEEDWGFCLPDRIRRSLPDGDYEVWIDTTLEPGSLTYAEHRIEGASPRTVLFSIHGCHPSLANDNLSALVVGTRLASLLSAIRTRYTYHWIIAPGTIGAIAWLARNRSRVESIVHGLVLTCLGDAGPFHYKRTRSGTAPIDRTVEHVLAHSGQDHGIRPFDPFGYDERQYNSPGFRLQIGRLSRAEHGRFPEYHTSADNLDFIRPDALAESLILTLEIVEALEQDRRWLNRAPDGEPQLGRRGLYRALGGMEDPGQATRAMLWLLSESDGGSSLLDIAIRAGMPVPVMAEAAQSLHEHGLLEPDETGTGLETP